MLEIKPSLALDFEILMRIATLYWMYSIDPAPMLMHFVLNLYPNIIRMIPIL